MTTIDEMDEFFNFDGAAHHYNQDQQDHVQAQDSPSYLSHITQSAPYDINLAFAEPDADERSFTCLQHFDGPTPQQLQHLSLDLDDAVPDRPIIAPDGFTAQDFTDFPRWIEGMNLPFQPCDYCKKMRIHCKVLKEGHRKGSCTSCVALARSCSLTWILKLPPMGEDSFHSVDKEACVPQDSSTAEADDFDGPEALTDWGDVMNSTSTLKPTKLPVGEIDPYSHSSSAPDLVALGSSNENLASDVAENAPKVGARFSRESVRILRGWLSTHHRHPYPTDEEKESLCRLTGLNKVQITNWLANARRRGKVRAPRSTSPSPNMDNYAKGMDIPRRGTPALQEMNPLERWKASPPEHEPASATAIAKAMTSSTFSSGPESPYTSYGHTEDGSTRSICNVSSASSLGTSHSSDNSFASAYSHKSKGSFGSFGSFGNRGRRRRRKQASTPVKVSFAVVPRTFQCTFCTETFKTKHDWQRHEKSLHLSLERWICSPNGICQVRADNGKLACVYCGLLNPLEDHAEQHNQSSCAERSLEERTFYRKDHLRQHLNLVHKAKFAAWAMDSWKVSTPEIRSRCGFCGIMMDSWSIRVDHLAQHFKGGKSMADWKGDWGFEPHVLDIVENGMPPYLIHDERKTMRPFEASREPADLDTTLEDLVKIGLVDYINHYVVHGNMPTDEGLLEEGRKIILEAEALEKKPPDADGSWFRDLIMLSGKNPRHSDSHSLQDLVGAGLPEIPWAEKLKMIKSQNLTDSTNLDSIPCSKQRELMRYVHGRQALGLTLTDSELRVQACKILDDIEVRSNYRCKGAVSWFKYLVISEPNWLAEFRRRAGLPRSSEMAVEHIRSTDENSIDNSIHNFARLENELKDYVRVQQAAGITPTDLDLQRKARLIIYQSDDPWNSTAADDPALLHVFKHQNGLLLSTDDGPDLPSLPEAFEFGPGPSRIVLPSTASSARSLHWDLAETGLGMSPPLVYENLVPLAPGTRTVDEMSPRYVDAPLQNKIMNQPSANTNPTQPLRFFLNDANCYGRLVRELNRFVTSCTSPNNPNQHIPTDAEIQNQARWIIYDDDDPWNQTAADNAEWLIRFKRDVGLAPSSTGPGLPCSQPSWRVGMGGSGFAPPYLHPKGPPAPFTEDVAVKMKHKVYKVQAKTAGQFLHSMGERWARPATVFCSRELESELGDFVRAQVEQGVVPSDEALRAKARAILGVGVTAADDGSLLEKFKSLHGISGEQPGNFLDVSPSAEDNNNNNPPPILDFNTNSMSDLPMPNLTDDMTMPMSMQPDFDMELGGMDFTSDVNTFGLGSGGGASLMGGQGLADFSPGGLGMGMGMDMGMDISGVDDVSQSQQHSPNYGQQIQNESFGSSSSSSPRVGSGAREGIGGIGGE